eukprot:TRINITY_DN1474_c0_g1_i1.p1 TRINITY_DN1474_c0_g1~~TRINITY_DN1474_c0_g1_i1.p1  ORF type:complete len:342 (-),score=69.86 TRINITY_DN1474_c0_g1_i1:97-1122(-)
MMLQPGQLYFIESCMNGKVLDVEGAGPKGSRIVMFQKKPHGNENQLWRFTPEGFLEAAHNGCVLDVVGGGGAGTRLCIWEKKPMHQAQNQLFRYDPRFQTLVCVQNGLVLDVLGENPNDGAHVIVHTAKPTHQNINQRWVLTPAGPPPQPYGQPYGFAPQPYQPGYAPQPYGHPQPYAPPPQPYAPHPQPYGYAPPPQPYGGAPPSQPVYIVSAHNGLVLDVQGGSTAPNSKVILWQRGGANQLWRYTPDEYIENVASGLVLDIQGGGRPGARLIIHPRKPHHEAANQRWRYDPSAQMFISHDNGVVLDVQGGTKTAGDYLCVWDRKSHHEAANQRWTMQP